MDLAELKSRLTERERQLAADLDEVRGALREVDGWLDRVKRLLPNYDPSASAPASHAEEAKDQDQEDVDQHFTEMVYQVVASKGDSETFEKRNMRVEVEQHFGLTLGEKGDKRVSNALRGLHRAHKIKLVRAGGPRRPAIYANLAYSAPDEESATEEQPAVEETTI